MGSSQDLTRVLYSYAMFIFLTSVSSFIYAGFEPKAKTALIFGCAGGGLVSLCARLIGNKVPPKKGEKGYAQWMAGVHVGLLLPVFYGFAFVIKAQRIFNDPSASGKLYLAYTFSILAAGSAVAFGLMVRLKPKKKDESATK